ncbi:MAG: hypothetical protein H6Q73_4166 [Firmicutes bacterium]|nr:hypothetical protein [Bacillota bacterium]
MSTTELQQLEQHLIRDGCREPLCVWNNTILDGHNRYEICTRLQIPFSIQRIQFTSCEEATAWICANQLGRHNITDETRKYLIGKRYEMEKILGSHNAARTNQYTQKEIRYKILTEPTFNETTSRTSERLGEEYHLSYATINNYGIYAHALDELSTIVPELVSKVLLGEIKISLENLVELSQLSQQDICRLSKHVSDSASKFVGYSDMRKVLPKRQDSSKKLPLSIPNGSIKDMPAYDPDAEISSLTLTVPSWVSSIDRTRATANLSDISRNARRKLEKELLVLKKTIDTMLAAIKEEI